MEETKCIISVDFILLSPKTSLSKLSKLLCIQKIASERGSLDADAPNHMAGSNGLGGKRSTCRVTGHQFGGKYLYYFCRFYPSSAKDVRVQVE